MKVLVTGADGFVGTWLVQRLVKDGHEVIAAVRPAGSAVATAAERFGSSVAVVPLELHDTGSVQAAVASRPDAVVHLAGVASGAQARQDPGEAWEVNAGGTARLAQALLPGRGAEHDPLLLLTSTAEVYGRGATTLRVEADPVVPCSPYAASKLGAEIAALEVHRRGRLKVVIARAFPHSGRGQDERFVIPAFAKRIRVARRVRAPVVKVGNLDPVRDLLHVSDVVDAYVRLLTGGQSGEVYNIASGRGWSLEEIFHRLAKLAGLAALPEVDHQLARPADIPYLVGDSGKLRAATGWQPRVSVDDTLAEVLNAQTD